MLVRRGHCGRGGGRRGHGRREGVLLAHGGGGRQQGRGAPHLLLLLLLQGRVVCWGRRRRRVPSRCEQGQGMSALLLLREEVGLVLKGDVRGWRPPEKLDALVESRHVDGVEGAAGRVAGGAVRARLLGLGAGLGLLLLLLDLRWVGGRHGRAQGGGSRTCCAATVVAVGTATSGGSVGADAVVEGLLGR